MKSNFKYYFLTVFLIGCLSKIIGQTTSISGVINNYASVTSIGAQSVSVSSISGFMIGDKVLLIQMKGATIDTTNTLNFGIISSYNDAGNYEMLTVSAISSGTITFTNPISRTYNIVGLVQLIKVPVYNNVSVTGLLTCLPWNGLTGGVLVFEAIGNVTLNANIDVTGKGFLGGSKVFGQFTSCAGNTTDFKLPNTSLVSANKGEGIVIIKPSFAKGMGALANGGGSGNDVNGGGAGGGNYGMGGRGGNNKCSTSPSAICGGHEGKNCAYSNINNRIFLGGGGGGGHENDGVSTGGVSGGGIIVIRCGGCISGNGNFINANGNNNTLIAGNDGQGGGGAGGAVLIDACSTVSLNISVKGGYGGTDNFTGPDCHGKGGGGGGGIIWTSSSLTYTSFLNGGNPGVFTNSASQCFNTSNGATVGQTGGILTGLSIPGSIPLSSGGSFSLTTSSNCISNNNSTAIGTITTNVTSPLISYTWTNSSGIISQTNSTTTFVDSVVNLANGVYTLSVQMNAPCGPVISQTLNISCIISPTAPCSGILTGTGMSVCSQFSFSISPTQTITPFNYGSQNYSCNNTTLPDVSFNIMGSGWRVEKHGWNFSATVGGQISGYNSSGVLQTIPFLATNTITPLSYTGTFVQFAINGISVGSLLDQATFSISLNPSVFGGNSYTYCANTATSIAISPISPTTGGPWTYIWLPGNLNGSPVNVSPLANTIYSVTATSIGGCASTATIDVNINCTITQTVPTAFFTSPDTVCVNQSFLVSNLSAGATSNYWTFCQGNTNLAPQSVNLGNIGFFNGPVFITIAREGTNYYAFVTNNTLGALTKLFFGSSLLNSPVATNLGNVSAAFPSSLEDLHLEYEGGNWYGIAVGGLGGSESVIRINFGSSLANNPTAINMGNIGGLNYPQRLKIFKNGVNYFGFTTNRNNNTITRLNFGTSIANTPTGVNMGNIGALSTPDAIAIVNVSSLWYGYIINEGNSTITRLDFGNSLLNTPTGTNLGNTGALNGPRGIDMWTECNEVRGLITNRNSNDLLNMKLSAGPTGPVVTNSFGNIANFSFPHSITRFRSGDTLFAFITNVSNNTLSRIYYPGCVNSSMASSTLTTPPTISYNAPGNYYINLVINEGQISQTNYCKQITVVSNPTVVVSGANICAGSSASLTASGANSYSWSSSSSLSGSTGSVVNTSPSISESYTVTGTIGTCTSQAVSTVSVIPGSTISIIGNTAICLGQTTTLTAIGANTYSWTNSASLSGSTGSIVIASPQVTTTYTVTGVIGSCANSTIVTVSVVSQPFITVSSSSTSICLGSSLTLTANGASSYTWTPSVNATDSTAHVVVASPSINTTYTVIGGIGTCSSTAQTTINVLQNSPISVSDKTICAGTTETLIATGAATYSWSPSLGLNAITGQTVIASPLSAQMYIVSGTFTNGCIGNASALVTVINNPTISVSASSLVICSGQSSSLTAIGAQSYTWSPAMSLTNMNGSQTIATPLTTETYVVVGSSGVGSNFCSSTQTIEIQVLQKIIPFVSPSTSFCLGSSTILYASGGTIYSWNPTINVIKPNDSVTIVKPIISTIYTVTVSRNGLCPSTSSATVEVVVNPLPIVNAGNDTIVNIGEYITLQGTGNVDVGFLSPSDVPLSCNFCPTITVNPYNTTCYTLMGANQYYCYNFDEVCVSVLKDWDVYIPNTFTPNDDLKNEYFIPLGYGIEKINIVIFDRWGQQLFKEENTILGWDGKKNGKLCEQGIYVYQVEIFTLAGQVFNRTGHVNLLPRAN